jgi:hypothetical protein
MTQLYYDSQEPIKGKERNIQPIVRGHFFLFSSSSAFEVFALYSTRLPLPPCHYIKKKKKKQKKNKKNIKSSQVET